MAVHLLGTLQRAPVRSKESEVVCWEALHAKEPAVRQARRLYKASLPAEERIPWRWIKDGLGRSWDGRDSDWRCHLLLAELRRRRSAKQRVVGFAYGAYVPGYGGYGAYLGVTERCRGRGVGTRLWRLLKQRLQLDAACAGVPLPFLIWESRPPAPGASVAEETVWRARLRLWARVGAWLVQGVKFLTPNFADPDGCPVAEQLFLMPLEAPASAFDSATLHDVVAGLHRHVYGHSARDPLVGATLPRGCRLSLAPLAADDT
jgi:hypothetical protein